MTADMPAPGATVLRVFASTPSEVTIQDLTTFIYDVNLLYELNVQLRLDPESIHYTIPIESRDEWMVAAQVRSA